jgi:aspartate carbamoyltransferase catalytic subunit
MFGGKIILCGPKECLPESLPNSEISVTTDLKEAISKSDILYTLRIQKERHKETASYYDTYNENYGINLSRLKEMNKLMPVYHPGPANIGVELDLELMQSPYYLGYQQVVNSVYMRMAIVKAMLLSSAPKKK